MNANQLFGLASILFGAGFLLRSFPSANAQIGPSASLGSNPIVSFAGKGDASLVTVPTDQDLILTDLDFCNTNSGNYGHHTIYLKDAQGNVYGQWWLRKSYSELVSMNISKQSGIRIPAGTELYFDEGGSSYVTYTISGYYVNP